MATDGLAPAWRWGICGHNHISYFPHIFGTGKTRVDIAPHRDMLWMSVMRVWWVTRWWDWIMYYCTRTLLCMHVLCVSWVTRWWNPKLNDCTHKHVAAMTITHIVIFKYSRQHIKYNSFVMMAILCSHYLFDRVIKLSHYMTEGHVTKYIHIAGTSPPSWNPFYQHGFT